MSTLLSTLFILASVARVAEADGGASASTASSNDAAGMHVRSSPADAGSANFVERVSGVYKARIPNGDVSGGSYTSENILEIVRYEANSAYVRVRLEFYNGHTCTVWGIARLENDRLIYRERTPVDPMHVCQLAVSLDGSNVVLSDSLAPDGTHSCIAHCGSRGSMNAEWPASARRPIRYMGPLLNSRQYKAAVAEYEGAKGPPGAGGQNAR